MYFNFKRLPVRRLITLLLLTVAVILPGCSERVLFRAGANYFPLFPGAEWCYAIGADTIEVWVDTLPEVKDNQQCIVVYRNYAKEFYITSPTEVRKLFIQTESRPGGEDTVEYRFGLLYSLPLILGDAYRDSYDTTLIWGPDTVVYSRILRVRVAAVENVVVPAGEFFDCYRLEFVDSIVKDTTVVINSWAEWLAPNVGVVKRITGGDVEVLVEHRRKKEED